MIQENEIFEYSRYKEACECIKENQRIEYIDTVNGVRRYKIVEIPQPTEKELAQQEIQELKVWFDIEYARKEQKYRRIHSLGKLTYEGKDPYNELINLYNEAEIKRARIQELERLLSDNSK